VKEMHGRENKLVNNEIEKLCGRPRCRKKSIIKVDLREICCVCGFDCEFPGSKEDGEFPDQ
jgi:hypothetical protein